MEMMLNLQGQKCIVQLAIKPHKVHRFRLVAFLFYHTKLAYEIK